MNRTDRTNRFYEGIDNPGLVLLHDILMTYCMFDFDLGESSSLASSFRLLQSLLFLCSNLPSDFNPVLPLWPPLLV